MSQAYGSKFAKVYNMMWGAFATSVAPRIWEFYEKSKLSCPERTVLDLCCGTGHLACFFLEKGYYVIGLDLSADMLNYARKNAEKYIKQGKAKFVQANASQFGLAQKVGLVVSTYDALNHLNNIAELKGCFKSVYKVLQNQGYFIFDLNTQLGLKNDWNAINYIDTDQITFFNRGIYDYENKKAVTNITGFIEKEKGLYERFDEIVYNTAFDLAEVREILRQIGWQEVYFAKSTDLSTPLAKPEEEGRVFIVAKKD